jgi:hypothetical protein
MNPDGGPSDATGNNGADGSTGDMPVDLTSQEEYCMGEGPPILRTPEGDEVCTGEVAAVSFRYAICTCENFDGTDDLFTDSFNSANGPYMPNMAGEAGSVGSNGQYTHTNKGAIGGSLWISGGDLSLTNEYDVAGELKVDGNLTSTSELTVGLDAYVTGDATVDTYTVDGIHHQPQGATFNAADPMLGGEAREPVTVAEPCDCDPEDLVDIDGFIETYRTANDNDSIDLDPDALSDVTDATELNLSCGRFFLNEITGTNEITITAEDRTALFVGGDVSTTGKLTIQLAEGAELDLFVAGTFTSTDEVDFGSVENPANVRLYLGGDDEITWTNKFSIGGNVYAPTVDLTLTDEAEIYGSLFVRNLTATNKLTVHYDSSVLNAGDTCDGSGSGSGGNNSTTNNTSTGSNNGSGGDMCMDCRDCLNQSCNDGMCGTCDSNDDCCAPLLCLQGECTVID